MKFNDENNREETNGTGFSNYNNTEESNMKEVDDMKSSNEFGEQKIPSNEESLKEKVTSSEYESGDVFVAAASDDHYSENETKTRSAEEVPKSKRKFMSKGFMQGIIGAVIGASLVMLVQPLIYGTDGDGTSISNNTSNRNTTIKADKQLNVTVESQVTKIVQELEEAVVGVVNIQNNFQDFGGLTEESEAGTGSGVVYKKDGKYAYIVTNNHVVEGAKSVEVTLADGSRIPAEIVGTDIFTDLAVLKVNSNKITKVAKFGDSDAIKKGEPVIAIGNPLGEEFSGSVTQGIISGKERTIDVDLTNDGVSDWQVEVLQTDAAINPGNSGGALVNMDGEVIGINSMKIATSAVEGIGLSIPSDVAKPIIEDLEMYGEVQRPYMGVEMRALNEIATYHWKQTLKLPDSITSGVAIMSVKEGSPAAKAGLKDFDVVVELDGKAVTDTIEFRKALYEKKIGEELKVTYYRNGKKQTTTVKLVKDQI